MTRVYAVDLIYNKYSSVGKVVDTLELAKKELTKDIAFYSSSDCNYYDPEKYEWHISEICSTCLGRGEVWTPWKKTRVGKMVKCPDCKGKNSEVKII